jgi:hypothetical protein
VNVSAIIVTRGDVDLDEIYASLPDEWETIIWNNGWGQVERRSPEHGMLITRVSDLSVYGRYAAIEYASHDLIYVQDDDVIVSDPQAIVRRYEAERYWIERNTVAAPLNDHLVSNMPQEFRHGGYTDSCLVGFGACFHRDAPARAFQRYSEFYPVLDGVLGPARLQDEIDAESAMLNRTCDVVFTTLAPRVLVDVPKTDLPYATDASRMYRQPDHVGERQRVLEMARKVRDAGS